MDSKIINRRDLDFVLYELLEVEALTRAPRFAEHSRETFGAAIDTALQIATDRFAPHNRKADLNEPKFDGERVALIPEVGDALKAFMAAGLLAATHDYDDGGMQLPRSVANACRSVFKGANISTDTYATLTIGVANMLIAFGSAGQKRRYTGYLHALAYARERVQGRASSDPRAMAATATPANTRSSSSTATTA